jgi:hypothetical protein
MRNVVVSALVLTFSACTAAQLHAASDSDQTNEPFGVVKSFAPEVRQLGRSGKK